jgi:hypothetical protein
MQKIEKNFSKIVLAILVVLMIGQCSNCRRSSNIEKQIKTANSRLDSMANRDEVKRIIEIEGLKAEKRMIQSTDRKILDVNRQSEIDAELKKIGGN